MFFGLFWTAITVLFDVLTLVPAARQIAATRYPSTDGTVVSSGVMRRDDSEDGPTYGASVSYAYSVGGKSFTGSRYRSDN